MNQQRRGAILVLSTSVVGQLGPVASWVSTAGWAGAIRRTVGSAWIVTPEGPLEVDEVRGRGSSTQLRSGDAPRWRRHLPVPVKTAIKDVREWRRARAFHVDADGPWRNVDIEFVWQRHELFQTAGLELARRLGVPSVLFVPATLVWQAEQWQVRRPGWSRFVERHGEARVLTQADVVAAGSERVAEEVVRLGVDERRVVIVRTGFDPDLFSGHPDRVATRRRLGIGDEFVVGWVGSFRGFHSLEQLVAAVARMDERAEAKSSLLLVGDGPERAPVEALAAARGVHVVSTGTVPQHELHALISAMDVAVLLAGRDAEFHYSPLKLAEYLASGVAVVAPRAGAIPAQLTDGRDALLVDAGDVAGLSEALARLRDRPEERARLAIAARAAAEQRFSWDHAASQVVGAIARVCFAKTPVGKIRRDASSAETF
jgi:glycosyltransferase involved in cell wall biosynthesis